MVIQESSSQHKVIKLPKLRTIRLYSEPVETIKLSKAQFTLRPQVFKLPAVKIKARRQVSAEPADIIKRNWKWITLSCLGIGAVFMFLLRR